MTGVVALTIGGGAVWLTFTQPGRLSTLVGYRQADLSAQVDDVRGQALVDRASRSTPRTAGRPGVATPGRSATISASPTATTPAARRPTATPTAGATPTTTPSRTATRAPARAATATATRTPSPTPKPTPSKLADGRPNFQLPFTCGERWRLTTYANHNPEDAKIDFFKVDGETRGADVRASAPGVVNRILPEIGAVKIYHGDRWYTMYNHMDPILVEVGQKVAQGEVIGKAGSTGTGVAHVHYEQIYDSNNDDWGSSPSEIVHPIIQGEKFALHAGDEPVRESTNNC